MARGLREIKRLSGNVAGNCRVLAAFRSECSRVGAAFRRGNATPMNDRQDAVFTAKQPMAPMLAISIPASAGPRIHVLMRLGSNGPSCI
jgi:hypothetical protein